MKVRTDILAVPALLVVCAWGQDWTPRPDINGVYPVLKGVKPARIIHGTPAIAPDDPSLGEARRVCALRAVIGADGKPDGIEVVNKSSSPFDEAAMTAARQSQFESGSYKSNPVATSLILYVPFLGKDRPAVPIVSSGGAIKSPKYLKGGEAHFPPGAPLGNYEVLIQLVVTEDGLPSRARVVGSVGRGFDEKALQAVNTYRFSPATLEGIPVPALITVAVNFKKW